MENYKTFLQKIGSTESSEKIEYLINSIYTYIKIEIKKLKAHVRSLNELDDLQVDMCGYKLDISADIDTILENMGLKTVGLSTTDIQQDSTKLLNELNLAHTYVVTNPNLNNMPTRNVKSLTDIIKLNIDDIDILRDMYTNYKMNIGFGEPVIDEMEIVDKELADSKQKLRDIYDSLIKICTENSIGGTLVAYLTPSVYVANYIKALDEINIQDGIQIGGSPYFYKYLKYKNLYLNIKTSHVMHGGADLDEVITKLRTEREKYINQQHNAKSTILVKIYDTLTDVLKKFLNSLYHNENPVTGVSGNIKLSSDLFIHGAITVSSILNINKSSCTDFYTGVLNAKDVNDIMNIMSQ